ncbi:MAG: transaldolase [Chloroflexi bacterium]|nr:transaldolase [Chloroflexota bacterium]MCI0783141.1 transaldolase [Chloroflexota bacterium]MCI0813708.1 transaldolase [Chloroflexota bacterium]MCI0818267.1 transaldolase [Chloroflexota bacterium]MCI0820425.1 transaldolase [Chloroflexota bacterium]
MANPLVELKSQRQSVWYDNLNRELIKTGLLQRLVDDDGVSGGTSNPSIFEKAVGASDAYDEHLAEIVRPNVSLDETYDALTVTDVGLSADIFRAVYDETEGADGYASLEVSPLIADDTETTTSEAKRLFAALDRPNAMIKIPGTPEGLPAVEQSLADGINVNITLLFGVDSYEQVALRYIAALETRAKAGLPLDRIASVASFFVSRVDSMVDGQLEEKIKAVEGDLERRRLSALLGKAGVANARIAYAKYQEIFSGDRWAKLAAGGARVQRCLWASTSTKNPDYRDVLYVEELIGPDTINTMPQNTLDAFRDHGIVAATLTTGVADAQAHVRELEAAGIDFRAVTDELQVQGVKLFADSFAKARATVEEKRSRILAGSKGIGAASRGD